MRDYIGACLLLMFAFFVLMFSHSSFAQTAPSCPQVQISGFSLTDDQGVAIGVGIMGVFCVAGIFKVLASGGSERDD